MKNDKNSKMIIFKALKRELYHFVEAEVGSKEYAKVQEKVK